MKPLARILAATSALLCSSPLLAEELTVSAVKAFDARMTAAGERCEVDAVVSRISPLASVSATTFALGDLRMSRMNKDQFRDQMTKRCAAGAQVRVVATNEKISIEGEQAVMTADVTETVVLGDRQTSVKVRQRLTIELIDGKLMYTQILSNLVE
jgi:enamine deaminase RidA (YjgF/YER057c/UK114 family)